MANFSSEIRRELAAAPLGTRQAMLNELKALLTVGGSADSFCFTTEDERVAERFLRLTERAFGINMSVASARLDPKQGKDKLTFSYTDKGADEFLTEIRAADAKTEEDGVSYLRGAFLGGGSCTIPHAGGRSGYHLEFVFPDRAAAEYFLEILDGLQLFAGVVRRGERYVAYQKNREGICDFFSVVGARSALRTLEAVSADRAERNNENRVGNCLAGNADKAAIASAAQTLALTRLKTSGMLASLPAELQLVAKGRLEDPTLSMSELAARLGISKSCLNHRMRKLMQLTKEL